MVLTAVLGATLLTTAVVMDPLAAWRDGETARQSGLIVGLLVGILVLVVILLAAAESAGRHLTTPDVHPLVPEFGWLALVASLVVVAHVGFPPSTLDQLGVVLAASVGAIAGHVCHIALHEFGHWVAARMAGVPCLMIAIGPFVKQLDRRQARWRRARWTGFSHGFVQFDLRRRIPNWRQTLVGVAGGTLTSAILATVAGTLGWIAWTSPGVASPWDALVLAVYATIAAEAVIQVVATVVAADNDGKIIRQAVRLRYGSERTQTWRHPRAFVEIDVHGDTVSAEVVAGRLYGAIARTDVRAAASARDAMLVLAPEYFPQLRGDLMNEAAFATALLDGDDGTARRLLDEASRYGLDNAVVRARAEAAVLIAEGDPAGAIDAAQRGLAAYGDDRRDMFWERDWLVELRRQAEGMFSDFTPWFARHDTARAASVERLA